MSTKSGFTTASTVSIPCSLLFQKFGCLGGWGRVVPELKAERLWEGRFLFLTLPPTFTNCFPLLNHTGKRIYTSTFYRLETFPRLSPLPQTQEKEGTNQNQHTKPFRTMHPKCVYRKYLVCTCICGEMHAFCKKKYWKWLNKRTCILSAVHWMNNGLGYL